MARYENPTPISDSERRARIERIDRIAMEFDFPGIVEYRHVYSRSGGAQYYIGPNAEQDLIVAYAEAFERDADPADYSLEALIAHECGHHRLTRDRDLQLLQAKFPGEQFEEILASLVGSLLLSDEAAAQTLIMKATLELADTGISAENTVNFIKRLRLLVRHFL
jgi:hypothetical protein